MSSPAFAPSREEVIGLVGAHRAKLKHMGVRSLSLFGSVARGDASPTSDVDLLADLQPMGLFSIIRIEQYLSDVLERNVDLVPRQNVRPELKARVESEALTVI